VWAAAVASRGSGIADEYHRGEIAPFRKPRDRVRTAGQQRLRGHAVIGHRRSVEEALPEPQDLEPLLLAADEVDGRDLALDDRIEGEVEEEIVEVAALEKQRVDGVEVDGRKLRDVGDRPAVARLREPDPAGLVAALVGRPRAAELPVGDERIAIAAASLDPAPKRPRLGQERLEAIVLARELPPGPRP